MQIQYAFQSRFNLKASLCHLTQVSDKDLATTDVAHIRASMALREK